MLNTIAVKHNTDDLKLEMSVTDMVIRCHAIMIEVLGQADKYRVPVSGTKDGMLMLNITYIIIIQRHGYII